MTDIEVKIIDDLLESNLYQQRFLLRMANVRWRRMKEKEAHLDEHQHSKEFWRAYGSCRYARKMIAAYETLICFWKSAGVIVKEGTKEMEETNIGKNIRHLRIRNGMSQSELAELAGYTDRSSICKIEAGEVDLSVSKIRTFTKIFQCDCKRPDRERHGRSGGDHSRGENANHQKGSRLEAE